MKRQKEWYKNYLNTPRFRRQRNLCYYLAFKRCTICFQKYDLQPHHLTYLVVGKWYEFLFMRMVCSRCHKWVQMFGHGYTNNTLLLVINYYLYRVPGILLYIGKWTVMSYWIPTNRKVKRVKRG